MARGPRLRYMRRWPQWMTRELWYGHSDRRSMRVMAAKTSRKDTGLVIVTYCRQARGARPTVLRWTCERERTARLAFQCVTGMTRGCVGH